MPSLRDRCALLLGVAAIAMGAALPAAAETVSTLRVMLHPYAAARGLLPPEALARLVEITGTPLTLAGTTRTGTGHVVGAASPERADAAKIYATRFRDIPVEADPMVVIDLDP